MSRTTLFAALALALFGVLVLLELWQSDEPFTWGELGTDLLETALLAGAVVFTAVGSVETRELRRERRALMDDLSRARREGEHWRAATRLHVDGLSRAIAAQFSEWGFSEAERDVAQLMLKGLSHKEIATLRGGSDATVRQQAAAVYRKSGLSSRPQFTGYFLEDLLAPSEERNRPVSVVK